MRKSILLLTMLLVTSVGGVTQAKTYQPSDDLTMDEALAKSKTAWEKTSFDWNDSKIEWGATYTEDGEEKTAVTVDKDTKTITKLSPAWNVNNAISWYNGVATDISGYDRLVLELEEASNASVEVGVCNNGYWAGNQSFSTLAKGETKLVITLSDLKYTGTPGTDDTWKTGDAVDLTKVNLIFIRTDISSSDQVIKVKDFYLAKNLSDKVTSVETTDETPFVWDDTDDNAKIEWGATYTKTDEDKEELTAVTVDNTTKTITKLSPAWRGNNAIAWYNYKETDISGYDKLVLKLEEASNGPVEVVVSNGGFWGGNSSSSILATGETELVLTLSGLKYTGKPGDNDTWKTGDAVDLTKVNLIFIRTDNGTANQVIKVKDFYLAKAGATLTYLIRSNTAADTYGTISLPYAAAKPENATVYDVVGYDDSNVYLKEVEALEAGKAYVFKSTDGNDITFTKTGDSENLTSPATGNALTGYFDAEDRSVPAESYILYGGQWLRVTADGNNTVGKYRAYLTLSEDLKVASAPAKAVVMTLDGNETTGINSVNAADDDAPVYNLSGMRVKNPTRGIYVKNGKKYIVK